MQHERTALLGCAAASNDQFPWLIKFLDANDWLSVQVHPDEDVVRHLWPGEGSKTEAWLILAADSRSKIYAGLRPGMDEARLRAAVADGTVADCLHCFEPKSGDCVFLPAGTVHAVGGGVLMAEVQQTSDATFRLFDWNRRDSQGRQRQLHVEESMASIHWDQRPVSPYHAAGFEFDPGKAGPARRQPLVRCRYFELEYVETSEPLSIRDQAGQLQALIVISGQGELASANVLEGTSTGQVWLLPAAMVDCQCRPRTTMKMLLCTLP
jgi:mannose-6-phosphate isomerase